MPLVEVAAAAGHEYTSFSPALLLTHLLVTTDDIGIEAVIMSRRDGGEDAGKIGQGQARLRLTPSGQGVCGTGSQDNQKVVVRRAGASGDLMGALQGRARAFRSGGGTQSLHALRLEGEAGGGVVHERAS